MISIGDFARLGRVSVRMLRHYDEIGLLRPARVDSMTGYRYYQAAQLSELNRIIALKDLGFTLQQVQQILEQEPSVDELKAMLRMRRAELESRVRADIERLARVEARISIIEREGLMPTNEVVIKQIPPVKVVEMRGVAASYEPDSITPVVGPLFEELIQRLEAAGVMPAGPGIAYYEPVSDGVLVHAAFPIGTDSLDLGDGVYIVDLPEIEAATLIYHGSMDHADRVVQELARWIEAHGYVGSGYAREVYLEAMGPRDQWVTEFQEPVIKAAGAKG